MVDHFWVHDLWLQAVSLAVANAEQKLMVLLAKASCFGRSGTKDETPELACDKCAQKDFFNTH